jgi:predicted MFS family arabinose efflux permease
MLTRLSPNPCKTVTPTTENREKTDWLAIAVLFLAGLAAAMHFAKVAPIMGQVGSDLGLTLVAAGFAVSLLGIVGVVFATAMGALVAAIGLGRGILIALFGGALVAAAGSIAPNSSFFLASRFLEGFSHLLIVVCAPALMAMHAAPRDRPVVLSLWGCFFGVGFAATSAAAPLIVTWGGWRGLMQTHALLLVLIGLTLRWALKRSGHADARGPRPTFADLIAAHADVYRSGPPLLLALTFCCYTVLFLAALTFLGRYLTDVLGWTAAAAGSGMAVASLISMVFTLLAGFLIRFGLPVFLGFAGAFLSLAVSAAILFTFSPVESVAVFLILVMMAAFGLLPGFTFASVPAIAPTPALAALTYGAIAQFGNVGTFVGTPIFAALYGRMGWTGGALFCFTVCLAGIACAALLRTAMKARS